MTILRGQIALFFYSFLLIRHRLVLGLFGIYNQKVYSCYLFVGIFQIMMNHKLCDSKLDCVRNCCFYFKFLIPFLLIRFVFRNSKFIMCLEIPGSTLIAMQ